MVVLLVVVLMVVVVVVGPRERGRGRGERRGERRGRRPVQRFVQADAPPVALPPLVLDEQQDVGQREAGVALAAGQEVLVPLQGLARNQRQPGEVLSDFFR
ncbi:hypothetical protein EYF80_018530 [Liparis tanakae]|uniref:Secreted protein n=1 Tax=Liparis tanakae TaxID=230148 RepID=A0A4Z2I1S5_9TELE|nr:hypothetical protein EYF80_018530 [Liparis tanakae]